VVDRYNAASRLITQEFSVLISEAFAQTAAGAASNDPFSGMLGFMPLVLMFAVLYFLMIRPQQKKAKEHTKMMAALQKGDEIVTSGGMAGRISKVGENYMTVTVSDVKDAPVDVIVQKSAVATLLPKGTLKTL
jgi:preprotein translocase subunit YajC